MAIHDHYDNTHRGTDGRVELSPVEARQGLLGRPVLYVLVIGLILAMLAWAAAELFGSSIDTQTPADSQSISAPATTPATDNQPIVNDNQPAGTKNQTAPAEIDPTVPANQ